MTFIFIKRYKFIIRNLFLTIFITPFLFASAPNWDCDGNGEFDNICNLVYVDPFTFKREKTNEICGPSKHERNMKST